jgi:hypothetical protein
MKGTSAVARIMPTDRPAPMPAAAQARGRREQALNSIKACLDQLRAEATGHRAELAALLIGAAAEACLDALGDKEKAAEPK